MFVNKQNPSPLSSYEDVMIFKTLDEALKLLPQNIISAHVYYDYFSGWMTTMTFSARNIDWQKWLNLLKRLIGRNYHSFSNERK